MEPASRSVDADTDVNAQISLRVAALRAAHGLSLDALAERSGVSRSMISLVERGETSATATVLERLAAGLGVTLASLFDRQHDADAPSEPVARRAEQLEWRDPASGYVRRSVSPPGIDHPMRIVDVSFPPGQRVTFDSGGGGLRIWQQVWVLEGTLEVTVGDQSHRLRDGDCLAMELDAPIVFHNPTRKRTRYAVVIASGVSGAGSALSAVNDPGAGRRPARRPRKAAKRKARA